MQPFELDVVPSPKEALLLGHLETGDRIVVAINGRGYQLERGGNRVRDYLVLSLCNKHWLKRPGYPLFADLGAGRLTPRGEAALVRYRQEHQLWPAA